MWTLPNIITIVRICFTPVLALLPFIVVDPLAGDGLGAEKEEEQRQRDDRQALITKHLSHGSHLER